MSTSDEQHHLYKYYVEPQAVSDMTRRTLVLVLAGGEGSRLRNLTKWRAKPAVPFGGQYRLIDFVLSNLVTGGLRKVVVLTLLVLAGLWAVARQPVETTRAAIQPFFPGGFGGLVTAMGFTFIAFEGYDLIATVAEEIQAAEVPRAIRVSMLAARWRAFLSAVT